MKLSGALKVFILACALTSVAEAALERGKGLPVDSSIEFNSTCKYVNTVFVNDSGTIEISLSVNLTHVKTPHHGGCFNLVSASQSGSLYRLICAKFGKVMFSNGCISYNKPPMKDLCHYGVEKLDFNKTSEDGLSLLILTLKKLDSICGRRLKLAYESMGLSKDEACDFQCTVTTSDNTCNSLPLTSPVSTPSKSVPTEGNNSLTSRGPTTPLPASENRTLLIVIISVIVGVVLLVFIIGLVVYCCYRKKACHRRNGNQGNGSERLEMNGHAGEQM